MTSSKAAANGRSHGSAGTARERARAQITREIKDEARRQLAEQGAQRLSLRAVARELGMVSSALYRYFASRDELLTALIIDAYDALGAAAEAAVAAGPAAVRDRWRACCHAARDWAIAHPHEYALIYGSPVPGYQAPAETIAPAGRVALVIGGLLAEVWRGADGVAGVAGVAGWVAAQERLPGQLAGQASWSAASTRATTSSATPSSGWPTWSACPPSTARLALPAEVPGAPNVAGGPEPSLVRH
jgi:AcrR family transcriptional regulator